MRARARMNEKQWKRGKKFLNFSASKLSDLLLFQSRDCVSHRRPNTFIFCSYQSQRGVVDKSDDNNNDADNPDEYNNGNDADDADNYDDDDDDDDDADGDGSSRRTIQTGLRD